MSAKTMDILEQLKSLTLLETSELIKQIEATFDVDASVPKILPIYDPEHQIEKEDEPEKTEFDVILEEVPSEKKIAVLKLVRSLTGLGLKEAKDLVEATPQVLKNAIAFPDAEDIKQQLESVGGKVSLK